MSGMVYGLKKIGAFQTCENIAVTRRTDVRSIHGYSPSITSRSYGSRHADSYYTLSTSQRLLLICCTETVLGK